MSPFLVLVKQNFRFFVTTLLGDSKNYTVSLTSLKPVQVSPPLNLTTFAADATDC
jgi:hypothetical protein